MKEVIQCPFSTNGVANEQSQKVERFIATEASPYQPNVMSERFHQSFCGEVLGQDNLIARTTLEPRGDPQEKFELLCKGSVSYLKETSS
jgi:hypothetical protein